MKIAVITDPHLKPEGNKRDEGTGLNARFLDRVNSLRWAVADARDRGCEYLLFGGDLFDTAKPAPYQTMFAIDAFSAFGARVGHSRIIAIPGNHDMPRAAHEATAVEPVFAGVPGATVSLRPELIDRDAFQLVTLPYPRRAQLAAMLPNYSDLAPEAADKLLAALLIDILRGLHAQCDPSKPSILLAHASIDVSEIRGSIMADRDICLPLREIPEFDYGFFGHIHVAQGFAKYGRPNISHIGSADRCDFGEEGQAKYYVVIDLDEARWYPVEIPCREYVTFHLALATDSAGWYSDADLDRARDAICRVKLRRPEHVKPDLAAIEQDIRQVGCFDFYGIEPIVDRDAAVRSEAVTKAQTTTDLLGIWHQAKGCPASLDELTALSIELESEVAA